MERAANGGAAERELLILRHGKAKRPAGIDDFERPLARRGKEQARRIGLWLAGNGCLPDAVLSSPAERAIDTARRAARAAGIDEAGILVDPRLYEATPDDILAVIAERADSAARRLLVVGHNPGLEYLAGRLAGPPLTLGTGDLVRLAVPGTWRDLGRGGARLLAHVDPDTPPG